MTKIQAYFYISISMIGFSAAFCAGCSNLENPTPPPEKTAKAFAELMRNGNFDEAKTMLSKECEPQDGLIFISDWEFQQAFKTPIASERQSADDVKRGRQRFRATHIPSFNDGSFVVENGKIVELGGFFYLYPVDVPEDLFFSNFNENDPGF